MRRKNCIKTKHLLTLLLIFGIFVLYCSFNRYRENFFGGDDGDDDDDKKDEEKNFECDDLKNSKWLYERVVNIPSSVKL